MQSLCELPYDLPASSMKCIICEELFVSLCPNCYKPLCMLHGAQAEKKRIKGEFCKGKRERKYPIENSLRY